MKRTSAELKRIARENLQGHYGLPIVALILTTLITSALIIPFSLIYELNQNTTNFIIYQLANMIISLISVIFTSSIIHIHLKLARKEKVVFSDIFYCFTIRPDRFIISTLIIIAITLICMLPLFLLIFISEVSAFFVIALVVLLLFVVVIACIIDFSFAFVYQLLIDHDSMTALQALNTSRKLMKGNKGRLFLLSLSFIGWEILALLTCGIGFLWLNPYMTQTSISFYRDVIGELNQTTSDTPPTQEHTFYSDGVIADFDVTNIPSDRETPNKETSDNTF